MKHSPVHSMTGFSSTEGTLGNQPVRVEVKSLNHRFLDIKVRLPRDLSSIEPQVRHQLQSRFSRGSIDLKLERISTSGQEQPLSVQANLELAASYHSALKELQKRLGLKDAITTMDVATLPEVLTRSTPEPRSEELWQELEPLLEKSLGRLLEMRAHEGAALVGTLRATIEDLHATIQQLRAKRVACEAAYREKITERVAAVFEAYPLAEASIQPLLESRIAQELALLLDRTDIEEELTRFKGHLDHFLKILNAGGQVGRKLDFILQELHREINTLGNKAQDFSMSEEVVQTKVRLEQLREQVMNLE